MKCPSCDGDLENGWVEVAYTSWLPLLLASWWHAHCWFRPSGEGERVVIVPYGKDRPAYRCRKCDLIVIKG
jgi:hypothetical protein